MSTASAPDAPQRAAVGPGAVVGQRATSALAGGLSRTPGDDRSAPVRAWMRLLRSELRLIFLRGRNIALLAVLAAIPILIGFALWLSAPTSGGNGGGPPFLDQVAGNGVFLSFLALVVMLTLVLPLAVAVVAGDSIAGEAGHGTLRYLLTVPAGRTRLLGIKYTALVVFCVCACLLVTCVALIVGALLFPVGPVTLLSGTTISLAAGLFRLLLVTLYVAAAMAALAAIGLAISTLTEHPIAAIAALLVIAVASEVADGVPQFAVVHPYLPTHWWLSFDALLRAPVAWGDVRHGLLSFGVYVVVFGAIAWARITTADVTS
jgi:ABC-2 type transport system permease protein